MSKKKGPALYELISSSKESSTVEGSSSHKEDASRDDVNLEHNVLTPGRAIRMSIGTVGVLAAVCIALIIVSYTFGYQRGVRIGEQARDEYGARLQEVFVEPVGSTPSNVAQNPPSTTQTSGWGPIMSDPRQKGYYYFVLANGTEMGSTQLAQFCRGKGLETYVVSGHNTRRFNVIAFPGSPDRNSQLMKQVKTKILAIGQEWSKTSEGRGITLKDTYPIR